MITKSRVNRANFKIALVSNIVRFLRNLFLLQSPMRSESASHSHHDFALPAFDYQVWINFGKKGIQRSSSYLGTIAASIKEGFSAQSILLNIGSSGFFMYPIYERLFSVGNLDVGMVIEKILGRFCSKETNEKASFAINDSCEISKLCISHKTPMFNTEQYAINPDICTA